MGDVLETGHQGTHLILPATVFPRGIDMQYVEGFDGHRSQATGKADSVNLLLAEADGKPSVSTMQVNPDRQSSGDLPPFRPPVWLRGPHGQTIVGRAYRSTCRISYVRRRIDTPDGDFLDLDGVREPSSGPLVIVLHGLEGSSRSGYVVQTCSLLSARGARPVALNFRSCSGEPNRTMRSYHSGETGDLGLVIDLLRSENPGTPIGAIGYSLGGNALLCYLEETGSGCLDAAVTVSVPFDLAASARQLESGMGRVYAQHFLGSLRTKIRGKADRFPKAADLARPALAARTIRGIDDAWTAPVHGYQNAAHYYEACSALGRLRAIRTPTLLIQAEDDPFLPAGIIDTVRGVENPFLANGFTLRGGHLGYLGTLSSGRLWAEARAVEWLVDRLV